MVRAEKRKTPDGTTLTLHVTQDGKSVDVVVPHMETLSDAAITSQVEAQLESAGIDATVQVSDGRVQVQPKR